MQPPLSLHPVSLQMLRRKLGGITVLKTASLVWCNWICIGIFLTWLYTLAATGLLFPLPFDWQGISTLWVWVPELLAIAALHKKVRAGFFNMDLLRVV